MSDKTVAGDSSTAWQAVLLRCTAFPIPSAKIGPSSWWMDLVGQQPETEVSKPRLGTVRLEGTVESGKFVLEAGSARIDWRLPRRALRTTKWQGS